MISNLYSFHVANSEGMPKSDSDSSDTEERMGDTDLISLLQKQIQLQQQQFQSQQEAQAAQMQQILQLVTAKTSTDPPTPVADITTTAAAVPPFNPFDPSAELRPDYLSRFQKFLAANAVPESR